MSSFLEVDVVKEVGFAQSRCELLRGVGRPRLDAGGDEVLDITQEVRWYGRGDEHALAAGRRTGNACCFSSGHWSPEYGVFLLGGIAPGAEVRSACWARSLHCPCRQRVGPDVLFVRERRRIVLVIQPDRQTQLDAQIPRRERSGANMLKSCQNVFGIPKNIINDENIH